MIALLLFLLTIRMLGSPPVARFPAHRTSLTDSPGFLIVEDGSDSNCSNKLDWFTSMTSDYGNYDEAYDSLRYYIPLCYNDPLALMALSNGIGACFGSSDQLKSDSGLVDLRNWLISIRNLSQVPGWYCTCVRLINGTFSNLHERNYGANLAILKFLLSDSRCTQYDSEYSIGYAQARQSEINHWQDTDKDPTHDVFDSTLPSIHDLGLDTLLADAAVGVHYEALGPQIIGNALLIPNPTMGQVSLYLTIEREAYIHVEVFDLLGRQLSGVGYSGVFEPGTREVPLNLSQAPPGSYYLRLSTANNETRTMKLSKE
jgi:hypothetical protein